MPQQFIQFVASGLHNAFSRFRTPFGLTEAFQIHSSVRQGDPLAPLIFIMVVDALHCGLQHNPLFGGEETGYWLKDSDVLISSLGFADDTLVLTETWKSMWRAHAWVREFCRAHNLVINSNKTRLFGSDWNPIAETRCLWPVQGRVYDEKSGTHPIAPDERIALRSPSESFKYLGVWINLNLNWQDQNQKMNTLVMTHLRRMRVNRLEPYEKISMTREMIIAQLDAGFQVSEIPQLLLKKWNSAIMHEILRGPRWHSTFSVNPQAINCLTGIQDLQVYYHARRLGELLVRLNSRHSIAGRTARARWKCLRTTANGYIGPSRTNRVARILNAGSKYFQAEVRENPPRDWYLDDLRREVEKVVPSGSHAVAFTDGSTIPGEPVSGAGVCFVVENRVVWSGGFRVFTNGVNYVAEYAAASLAVALTPPDSTLDVYEDNLGAIASQLKVNPKERVRIRSAARAWRNTFEYYVLRRSSTCIHHVLSHTGKDDFASRGNEAADQVARLAVQQKNLSPLDAPNEEDYILLVKGELVGGDYFARLKDICHKESLAVWRGLRTQGQLARGDVDAILEQSHRIINGSSQFHKGELWIFYVLLVCNWLPTNHRRAKGVAGKAGDCNLCIGGFEETTKHIFSCPTLTSAHDRLRSIAGTFLSRITFPELLLNDPFQDYLSKAFKKLRNYFPEPGEGRRWSISNQKLLQLLNLFVTTNEEKLGLCAKKCRDQIGRILSARQCSCPWRQKHSCYLRNCWQVPRDLLAVVQSTFGLNCEGMADALHHSEVFGRWCSEFKEDRWFGAEFDFFSTDLRGNNVFVNPPFNSTPGAPQILTRVIDRCGSLCDSTKPTRVLLVVPVFEGSNGDRFLKKALSMTNSTVVAFLPPSNFSFDPPDDYCLESSRELRFGHGVALVLMCSALSLDADPIDWPGWKKRMGYWASERRYKHYIPAHPLDTFQSQINRAREIKKMDEVNNPNLSLMPWLLNRPKLNVKLSARVDPRKRESIQGLIRLSWTVAAAGAFPRSFKNLFDGDLPEYSRFCFSMLWGSFLIWDMRSRLEFHSCKRKEKSQRLGCHSPYHSLQSLVLPNRWSCDCPRTEAFTAEVMVAPVNPMPLLSVISPQKVASDRLAPQKGPHELAIAAPQRIKTKRKRRKSDGQPSTQRTISKRKRSVKGKSDGQPSPPVRRSQRIRKQARI